MSTPRDGDVLASGPSPIQIGGNDEEHISLCEALDRVLHKGVVIKGEVAISVANVDLVYLGLQVLLASMDTARSFIEGQNNRVISTDRTIVEQP
jgi:hypothetical protein